MTTLKSKHKPLITFIPLILLFCFSCRPIMEPMDGREYKLELPPEDKPSKNSWAPFVGGGSLGYGNNSVEGESTSSFCAGGEFMYNFLGNDQGGLYGGAFGNYMTTSSDGFDESLFRVGLRARYFDHIIPSQRLQLSYGADIFAESGEREFSMAKDDISGFGASAKLGLNLNLPDNFSIGVEAPVFTYLNRKYEYNGGEIEQSSTWFGINKDNVVMAYLRFGF
ncbi:hypothetical protein AB9K26_11850 [Psychroserpens sp. XS_ASV72]|uniref:hypothetical protein n=1 Tax=Psychroserpens sp. XS_ASV72 TaxID=3241293 RepID=UPI003512B952